MPKAALALVVVYLMIPLKDHLDASIGYWLRYATYDTAKECQDEINELGKRLEAGKTQLTEKQIDNSKCVDGNDPRLKEN
jgi:hypothetical protein